MCVLQSFSISNHNLLHQMSTLFLLLLLHQPHLQLCRFFFFHFLAFLLPIPHTQRRRQWLQPHICRVERWGSNNIQHFPKVALQDATDGLKSPVRFVGKKMNLLNTKIPALPQEALKPQTFTGSMSIREKEEKDTTSLHCMLYS